jgi:hypothetical protein
VIRISRGSDRRPARLQLARGGRRASTLYEAKLPSGSLRRPAVGFGHGRLSEGAGGRRRREGAACRGVGGSPAGPPAAWGPAAVAGFPGPEEPERRQNESFGPENESLKRSSLKKRVLENERPSKDSSYRILRTLRFQGLDFLWRPRGSSVVIFQGFLFKESNPKDFSARCMLHPFSTIIERLFWPRQNEY